MGESTRYGVPVGCGCDTAANDRGGKRSRHRCCRIWQILTAEGKTPEGDSCVVVPGHIVHKPDPCIYSQFLLMALDQPVTWDNPDVRILLNGVEQDTYNLSVSTNYDVEITVHNASREKPANGTSVDVRWIEFGAGAQIRHAINVLPANVPVWPGTTVVTTPWRTPDMPGHFCIEVELTHPNDGNPANNRGWNNTEVHAAHSAVDRSIRIFNRYPNGCPAVKEGGGPWVRPHRVFLGWGLLGATAAPMLEHHHVFGLPVVLTVLTSIGLGYVALAIVGLAAESVFAWMKRRARQQRGENPPPDRVDCHLVHVTVDSYEFEDGGGKEFDPDAAFQGRPIVWPAIVTPESFVFVPGEAFRDVDLHVDAPDTPGLTGHFNLSVRQGGAPSGGVTIAITTGS